MFFAELAPASLGHLIWVVPSVKRLTFLDKELFGCIPALGGSIREEAS